MTSPIEVAQLAQYELSINIDAPRSRVWHALTQQIGEWWPADFRVLGPQSLIKLDLMAGGRLCEQAADRELLWYSVLAVAPEESLSLAGHLTAEFGGPATTQLILTLHEEGGGTRLNISDALIGRVTGAQIETLRTGWEHLFTTGLKAFVESAA